VAAVPNGREAAQRHEIGDRVAGLESGTDDDLVRPHAGAKLVAGVKALLRPASVSDAREHLTFIRRAPRPGRPHGPAQRATPDLDHDRARPPRTADAPAATARLRRAADSGPSRTSSRSPAAMVHPWWMARTRIAIDEVACAVVMRRHGLKSHRTCGYNGGRVRSPVDQVLAGGANCSGAALLLAEFEPMVRRTPLRPAAA
jgi:hypothetical protein